MTVVGNAIEIPLRRNDHLETHQKFWRKHRRVALHSHPEERCPIAAGNKNPTTPELHHSLSHIPLQPLWHLCEGKTPAGFHSMGSISVSRQLSAPRSPELVFCSCSLSLSLGDFVHFPPSIHQRVDRPLVQWLQTKLKKNLQALTALQVLSLSDKIGLDSH